jgi:hypothetical protein
MEGQRTGVDSKEQASADDLIKAKSFTGEAVVLGPDGLSRFEELSRR